MDISSFLKNYADQIGGQFTAYNAEQSIIIVPLSGSRFQTVIGTSKKNELYNRNMIVFNSTVCDVKSSIDYRSLLEQSAFFNYCRFIVDDSHLKIEASTAVDGVDEATLKEMVQEVANLADQYEMKITGADIH